MSKLSKSSLNNFVFILGFVSFMGLSQETIALPTTPRVSKPRVKPRKFESIKTPSDVPIYAAYLPSGASPRDHRIQLSYQKEGIWQNHEMEPPEYYTTNHNIDQVGFDPRGDLERFSLKYEIPVGFEQSVHVKNDYTVMRGIKDRNGTDDPILVIRNVRRESSLSEVKKELMNVAMTYEPAAGVADKSILNPVATVKLDNLSKPFRVKLNSEFPVIDIRREKEALYFLNSRGYEYMVRIPDEKTLLASEEKMPEIVVKKWTRGMGAWSKAKLTPSKYQEPHQIFDFDQQKPTVSSSGDVSFKIEKPSLGRK